MKSANGADYELYVQSEQTYKDTRFTVTVCLLPTQQRNSCETECECSTPGGHTHLNAMETYCLLLGWGDNSSIQNFSA
jgi:hypothetical protein